MDVHSVSRVSNIAFQVVHKNIALSLTAHDPRAKKSTNSMIVHGIDMTILYNGQCMLHLPCTFSVPSKSPWPSDSIGYPLNQPQSLSIPV